MIAEDAPDFAGGASAERVRREMEAVLLRVVAAGRVAEVMWRLLRNEQRARGWSPARVDGGQDGALMRLVWQGARDSIAGTVHERTPWVYHAAVRAACPSGDRDRTALVLAELAGMHLRTGYAADSRRLVELADADEDLGMWARRVLAAVRGWVDEYEKRQHYIQIDHDGRTGSDGHER